MGAVCNIFGYYGIGLPIGASLMFAGKLGIKGKLKGCFKFQPSLFSSPHSIKFSVSGLWIGLLTCLVLQDSFLVIYLVRMNWKTATDEVRGKKTNTTCKVK